MFLKETEENIRRQFAVFTEKFERAGKEIEARIHAEPADIALLLKYLYANMPFSDVADYSYEMFREFAAHGAQLRKEQIWKGETRIPDEIFLDNVVFHRVNTEGITSCRPLFYAQLQERVAGKQMEAAILKQITGVPKKPLIRQRMTVPSLQRPCIETGSDAAEKSRYLR